MLFLKEKINAWRPNHMDFMMTFSAIPLLPDLLGEESQDKYQELTSEKPSLETTTQRLRLVTALKLTSVSLIVNYLNTSDSEWENYDLTKWKINLDKQKCLCYKFLTNCFLYWLINLEKMPKAMVSSHFHKLIFQNLYSNIVNLYTQK